MYGIYLLRLVNVVGGMNITNMVFTAIIHKEDEIYVAECPEVGTVSQGYTIEEAVANIREATELYLEEFPRKEFTHPLMTTFEAAVNA
jgi:predicted RNase H-like HicB family nuclease